MGKASRAKRERREGGGDEIRRLAAEAQAARRRQLPVFWIVLALIALGGIAAVAITATHKDSPAEKAAADAPVYSEITVTGKNLPSLPAETSAKDPAVGRQLPTISGTGFDNVQRTIDPTDGSAKVIVAVAHWCPHCQAEVPRIVDWAKDGKLPANVEVTAISTAASDSRPNFPPAAWLAKEGWPFDVIADDEAGTAGDALGLAGFPFIVFVNADGTIAKRSSGEMPISEFDDAVQALARKTQK